MIVIEMRQAVPTVLNKAGDDMLWHLGSPEKGFGRKANSLGKRLRKPLENKEGAAFVGPVTRHCVGEGKAQTRSAHIPVYFKSYKNAHQFYPCLILSFVGLLINGCSVRQLQTNTVDIGSSIGVIYTSQVLSNLLEISGDRNAMPSHFSFDTGKIKTQNLINPSLNIALGNTVTRTVVSNGISQIVAPYNALTLGAQEEWDQEWDITPETSADVLLKLRTIYLYVLWGSGHDAITREFGVPTDAEQPAKCGSSHTSDGCILYAIMKFCDGPNDGIHSQCFMARPLKLCSISADHPTISSNGRSWVCLTRNYPAVDRVAQREMVISQDAYDHDVLFDLVALSLQLHAEEKASPSGTQIAPSSHP